MNPKNNQQLVNALIAERVEPHTAEQLAREVPEVCRRQLSYLDYQDDLSDRTATLIASIEGDWPEPARSYWENATRRASQEKAAAEEAQQSATPTDDGEPPLASAEASEDVRNLLAALESIAVMSHAHRDDRSTPCPVCVAWDALKQWAHDQSLRAG